MDNTAKSELVDKLKAANNVLVTVSRNPSVDQLSACLGLTLLINKINKHAAAVFSGETPPAISFLQPEAIIEKNTDSLRDFIIALDKNKADKLRYKVEDDVVRIFITPYKTSLSEEDFDFSQGDFNIDVVVALGVHQQEELDEAITAHGRILHDATVASINVGGDVGLGSLVWNDQQASSLSELVTELAQALAPEQIDNQIATALLTGIVAETERFSNQKTSSFTMSASAALMAAGADQQLVASKLEEPAPEPQNAGDDWQSDDNDDNHDSDDTNDTSDDEPKPDDGTIQIDHEAAPEHEEADDTQEEDHEVVDQPTTSDDQQSEDEPQAPEVPETPPTEPEPDTYGQVTEPPERGGTFTASTEPEALDPATDPLGVVPTDNLDDILKHDTPEIPAVGTAEVPPTEPVNPELTPPPATWMPPAPENVAPTPTQQAAELADPSTSTLSDLEASVQSPHLQQVDDARNIVDEALQSGASTASAQPPIAALNAQPLSGSLHDDNATATASNDDTTPASPSLPEVDHEGDQFLPGFSSDPTAPSVAPNNDQAAAPKVVDSNAPPPVPPPIPMQFNSPAPPQQ